MSVQNTMGFVQLEQAEVRGWHPLLHPPAGHPHLHRLPVRWRLHSTVQQWDDEFLHVWVYQHLRDFHDAAPLTLHQGLHRDQGTAAERDEAGQPPHRKFIGKQAVPLSPRPHSR